MKQKGTCCTMYVDTNHTNECAAQLRLSIVQSTLTIHKRLRAHVKGHWGKVAYAIADT